MTSYSRRWSSHEGSPHPLGATWVSDQGAYNFAIYSKHAEHVRLLLFRDGTGEPAIQEKVLNPLIHKSGPIWHCRMNAADVCGARYYAYSIDGPSARTGAFPHGFDPQKLLLDPYAIAIHFPETFEREAAIRPGSNLGRAPLAVLPEEESPFDWRGDEAPRHDSDLVIMSGALRETRIRTSRPLVAARSTESWTRFLTSAISA